MPANPIALLKALGMVHKLEPDKRQMLGQLIAAAEAGQSVQMMRERGGEQVEVDPLGLAHMLLDLDTPERRQVELTIRATRPPAEGGQ